MYLDEPVKIGRSVARCRPAQNNATFDCKVLSRNHALVWFDHKTGKVRDSGDISFLQFALNTCFHLKTSAVLLYIVIMFTSFLFKKARIKYYT